MSLRVRAGVCGLVVLFAAASAAAPAVDASASRIAQPRISSMTGVPSSVVAGSAFRVRGRVSTFPRRLDPVGRLTFTLRTSARGSARAPPRAARTSAGPPRSTSRVFSCSSASRARVKPGRYTFRACVRRPRSAARGDAAARSA